MSRTIVSGSDQLLWHKFILFVQRSLLTKLTQKIHTYVDFLCIYVDISTYVWYIIAIIVHYVIPMDKDALNIRASNLLKAELRRAGVGYAELCQRLAIIGVNESYKGVANKINRGTFSFVFFMQCMKVLDVKEFRL